MSFTTTDSVDFMDVDRSLSPIQKHVDSPHFKGIFNSMDSSSSETIKPPSLTQWVYIQTPPKISIETSSINKNSNIFVNTMAPMQIPNLSTAVINKPIQSNPNLLLAHPINNMAKPQHVYIQKPSGVQTVPVLPVSVPTSVASKNPLTYFTMIKTPQQTGMNQKYVLASMPKLAPSRPPPTITTNSVKSKFALMPMPLQNSLKTQSKHNVLNLKIADGQLQSDNNGAIKVMCENKPEIEMEPQSNLFNEVINLDSPKKEPVEDKSYELSIVEDSESKSDVSYTISIPEDDKTKTQHFNRDSHKFQKHGVSILKKHFVIDKPEKSSSLIINPVPNSITTISDSSTKEVKISTSTNYNKNDPVIITECKVPSQKTERRRKSHFSYRKDYDEVIITSTTPPVIKLEDNYKEEPEEMKDVVEIKVIKEKPDINMNENFDAKKILTWDEGVGTLPGSDIRFQINEFGFLEYLKNDEYKEILEKKTSKPKEIKKENYQEEMRCQECGCYGLPSEFITPKYCSYDCQEVAIKTAKQKENKLKRKRNLLKKTQEVVKEIKIEKEEVISEEDSTSNDYSQDKFNYPWNSAKGFSWPKYLEHVKAKAAPLKFFKEAFPYNRNGFRPGMKLEGVDPQHPSYFCVLTVAEVIGYRLRLHFDGYSENYDFWVNADSMDIFPAGWCEKYGHILHPPPTYTEETFNWSNYLKQTKGTIAPKHLFANRAGSAICPNGFRVGMKLEAVDRKNTSLVCVATISDMMDNRILVHFDSWDDIYDYWADPTSPYIHPIGWADQNGHSLTPPNNYPNPETFTWESYLKETKSTGAPVRAFKQRMSYQLKRGMRLECVDKRVPQLIRVATVDDTREHQIRISFDGWPDRYSYWVDNDSPNIHPVGWCQKTGHPIEPPLTPDDVYDFLECPTVGCRGQGHILGSKYSTHSLTDDCPYSDENLNREHVLPDRLLSPDRQLQSVVPVSREPKEKIKSSKLGRPSKIARRESHTKLEWNNVDTEPEPEEKPLKRKPVKCYKNRMLEKSVKTNVPLTNGYTNPYTEQIWEKHSSYLNKYVRRSFDAREWQEEDVVQFIGSLPYSQNYGALFRKHRIDGEALLMLSQEDLVELLKIKLGPAIKLYSIIMLLRRNIS